MEKDRSKTEENLHKNHRQRVFDRLEKDGLDSFYDHEVLELLLFYTVPRRDTNPIAHRLINEFGSLKAVMDADIKSLEKVQGVSLKSAALISMLPQLIRRYKVDEHETRAKIETYEQALSYVDALMTGENSEVFYMICLDVKGRIISSEKIGEGSVTEVLFDSREVILRAAGNQAAEVIIAHNHPGGDSKPSANDIEMTNKIALALFAVGIKITDHIIISPKDSFSFKREGQLGKVLASVSYKLNSR